MSMGNLENVPIIIVRERRNGYRASFTKKGLTIRIQRSNSVAKEQEQIDAAMRWANRVVTKKPAIAQRYHRPAYESGMQMETISDLLTIECRLEDRKSYKAEVNESSLIITAPIEDEFQDSRSQSLAISRALAKYYKPLIEGRLHYWQRFFGERHNKLSIKYNESNWGSCSVKKNINISSRLLLTTMDCIDYVLVHELCHLRHFNHGPDFWALVEKVMPSYKEKQRELATYSHNSYF